MRELRGHELVGFPSLFAPESLWVSVRVWCGAGEHCESPSPRRASDSVLEKQERANALIQQVLSQVHIPDTFPHSPTVHNAGEWEAAVCW